MGWLTSDIYHSANGDRWQLLRHSPSGEILVRHTANAPSGGKVSDLPVEAFLAIDGPGPEFTSLRALLKRLASTA